MEKKLTYEWIVKECDPYHGDVTRYELIRSIIFEFGSIDVKGLDFVNKAYADGFVRQGKESLLIKTKKRGKENGIDIGWIGKDRLFQQEEE